MGSAGFHFLELLGDFGSIIIILFIASALFGRCHFNQLDQIFLCSEESQTMENRGWLMQQIRRFGGVRVQKVK